MKVKSAIQKTLIKAGLKKDDSAKQSPFSSPASTSSPSLLSKLTVKYEGDKSETLKIPSGTAKALIISNPSSSIDILSANSNDRSSGSILISRKQSQSLRSVSAVDNESIQSHQKFHSSQEINLSDQENGEEEEDEEGYGEEGEVSLFHMFLEAAGKKDALKSSQILEADCSSIATTSRKTSSVSSSAPELAKLRKNSENYIRDSLSTVDEQETQHVDDEAHQLNTLETSYSGRQKNSENETVEALPENRALGELKDIQCTRQQNVESIVDIDTERNETGKQYQKLSISTSKSDSISEKKEGEEREREPSSAISEISTFSVDFLATPMMENDDDNGYGAVLNSNYDLDEEQVERRKSFRASSQNWNSLPQLHQSHHSMSSILTSQSIQSLKNEQKKEYSVVQDGYTNDASGKENEKESLPKTEQKTGKNEMENQKLTRHTSLNRKAAIRIQSSLGYILISNKEYDTIKANIPTDLLRKLKIAPLENSVHIIEQEIEPMVSLTKKAFQWVSPPPLPVFEKLANGKLDVKSGNLLSIIGLLLTHDSVADHDYLTDVMRTYRYYADPIDVARILVLRYIETVISTDKDINWKSFVQLRVLNVWKKWATDHPEDFYSIDAPGLLPLLQSFLDCLVFSDPKRAVFGVSVKQKIDDYQTAHLENEVKQNQAQKEEQEQQQIKEQQDNLKREKEQLGAIEQKHYDSQNTLQRVSSKKLHDKNSNVEKSLSGMISGMLGGSSGNGEANTKKERPLSISSNIFSSSNKEAKPQYPDGESNGKRRFSDQSGVYLPYDMATSLYQLDPDAFAKQLTIMEQKLFQSIQLNEFFCQRWNDKSQKELVSPNLVKFIQWFNFIAQSAATQVVKEQRIKRRVSLLKRLIYIAHVCLRYANYNTCFEIVAGLNLGAVSRLTKTWKLLPKKYIDVWSLLNQMVSSEGSYRAYRTSMNTIKERVGDIPLIPYVGINLSDLTFAEDGNPTYLAEKSNTFNKEVVSTSSHDYGNHKINSEEVKSENSTSMVKLEVQSLQIINFTKFKLISELLANILSFQRAPKFNFQKDEPLQEWIKNHFLPVDENEMYILSKKCETRFQNKT